MNLFERQFEQRLALLKTLIELQRIEQRYEEEVGLVVKQLLIDVEVTEIQTNDVLSFFENPESYVSVPEFGGWTSKEIKEILVGANNFRVEEETRKKRSEMIDRVRAGEFDNH